MWHVYNLIRVGDRVTATTFRKVARDTRAGSESERVRIKLQVQVEEVDFDPEGGTALELQPPCQCMQGPHIYSGAAFYCCVCSLMLPHRAERKLHSFRSVCCMRTNRALLHSLRTLV